MNQRLHRHEQTLFLAGAAAILVLFSIAPWLQPLGEIAAARENSLALLASSRVWMLLLRSLLLSSAVTALALLIGLPLGVLFGRMDVPLRRALWVAHAFPMFLPPFLLALGWFHLLGRQGLLGGESTAALLFSEVGLVFVLGVTLAPIVTSLVAVGVMGVDASLEEAARLVARPWRVATHILLPAASPAIALAAIVVFALALSELGVPMFLRVDVFPAAVFARLGGVDYAPGEAFALALPLVPVAACLLILERRFVGRHSYAVLGLRSGARAPLPLRRLRAPLTAAATIASIVSVAPIAALAIRASRGSGGVATILDWSRRAPLNGVLAAAAAASGISAIGLIVGHAAARRERGASVLDALSVLAFVTPASVLGVGLIAVWNRAATQMIYGTLAILVVGYMARYVAVGVRVVASSVSQSPVHLEEAAAAHGAHFARRLFRIVLPLHARGVMFAWLLAAVFCMRDLETAVLFYPPGGEPLTVRIFTLEANGPESVVAGLALLQVGMTLAVLGLGAFAFLWRRAP
ncbi:ABC transporter permease subunit [Myxococcota bacterium]|nr:ABC transporter permease subunit [Myxococcota bacterium]MCK6575924.1 ABC transporter permease subunit [Myxococcota bacterium]